MEVQKQYIQKFKKLIDEYRTEYFEVFANILNSHLRMNDGRYWSTDRFIQFITRGNDSKNEDLKVEDKQLIDNIMISIIASTEKRRLSKVGKFILLNYNFYFLNNNLLKSIDFILYGLNKDQSDDIDEIIIHFFKLFNNNFPIEKRPYAWHDDGSVLKYDFIIYWMLFFHPEKIKKQINDIFKLDNLPIIKCIIKFYYPILPSGFLEKKFQRKLIQSVMVQYLTGESREVFFDVMKKYSKSSPQDFDPHEAIRESVVRIIELIPIRKNYLEMKKNQVIIEKNGVIFLDDEKTNFYDKKK